MDTYNKLATLLRLKINRESLIDLPSLCGVYRKYHCKIYFRAIVGESALAFYYIVAQINLNKNSNSYSRVNPRLISEGKSKDFLKRDKSGNFVQRNLLISMIKLINDQGFLHDCSIYQIELEKNVLSGYFNFTNEDLENIKDCMDFLIVLSNKIDWVLA